MSLLITDISTPQKQDIQTTLLNSIHSNLTNTLLFLNVTTRFNNGLTSTSFTANSIINLNTVIQLFINANPLRKFKMISHAQSGISFTSLLIHSL